MKLEKYRTLFSVIQEEVISFAKISVYSPEAGRKWLKLKEREDCIAITLL